MTICNRLTTVGTSGRISNNGWVAVRFASVSGLLRTPCGKTVHGKNTDDGLRGFEVRDNDGYVLFFGRPAPSDPLG